MVRKNCVPIPICDDALVREYACVSESVRERGGEREAVELH